MQSRVLVISDEDAVVDVVARALRSRELDVEVVRSHRTAADALSARVFDHVLMTPLLENASTEKLLDRASRGLPTPKIVLLGRPTAPMAERALASGRIDVLDLPLDSTCVSAWLDRARAPHADAPLVVEDTVKAGRTVIIRSEAMQRVFDLAEKVARTPSSSALILGESGVGKEVVAAHVHQLSSRASGPFVRVNLSAIPDTMLEGELFGSVRGSYTGSSRDRAGHFASADGGTLLLDEIGEFKVEHQAKLLRVLEQRRFFPIGSDREKKVDVRVIAATNRDPARLIADGLLREDLYYRLGTVVIRVPPLRERTDEILPLAKHFLAHFCRDFRRSPATLTEDAERALLGHAWPGNVREIRNVIERAVMTTDRAIISSRDLELGPRETSAPRTLRADRPGGTTPRPMAAVVTPSEVPASAKRSASFYAMSDDESLRLDTARQRAIDEFERAHIAKVLELASGSRTKAAALLGISRSTLWEKLKKYGMAEKTGTEEG
jgi:DNA-binding NtrC family response regulator